MGLLSFTSKPKKGALTHLPSGCFTVDRTGRILSSTLPQSFPSAEAQRIAHMVIAAFQTAARAHLVFTEFQVKYSALTLIARELKGGALIFLTPHARGLTQSFNPQPYGQPQN
jgi:hypothetical protein